MTDIEQLGPYRLEHVLGRGGMGIVYAAVNQQTGTPAAVKILSAATSAQPSFRERFMTEIETLIKLKHPNIVEIFGYGEQQGQLFFAMERINGGNLQTELVAGRRFSWQETLRIGLDVCRALKLAHDMGIVHRDLKPANLLLDERGSVKLTDFGIVKLFGAERLTGHGSVIGTADYMSPEQAEGRPIDHRSDLYSLGCVLYALAAGRPPFVGKSIAEVFHKLCYEDPKPLDWQVAGFPVEVSRVVMKLLEKKPENRYPTARATALHLEIALEHAAGATQVSESPSPAPEDQIVLDPSKETAEPPAEVDEAEEPTTASLPAAEDEGPPAEPAPADEPDDSSGPIDPADSTLAEPGRRSPPTVPPSEGNVPTDSVRASVLEKSPLAPPTAGRGHYTSIDRPARSDTKPGRRTAWYVVSQVVGVVTVLALLVVLFVSWNRYIHSADVLFAKIQGGVENASLEGAGSIDRKIDDFLQRYPDDPRAGQVVAVRDQLEQKRLIRRWELRAKLSGRQTEQEPAERLLLEAIRLESETPEAARLRYRAILDLFGPIPEPSPRTREVLDVARQRLAGLEEQLDAQNAMQLEQLEEFIAQIEATETIAPEAMEQFWRAIIVLYGDRSWAEPVVRRAREKLGE